jgi:hypothetical protein
LNKWYNLIKYFKKGGRKWPNLLDQQDVAAGKEQPVAAEGEQPVAAEDADNQRRRKPPLNL